MTQTDQLISDWYPIEGAENIDSPALVIYRERVARNIQRLLELCPDTRRLRPHVKTHKSAEATSMLMKAGVGKFKCATIAEAEMLALSGAPDVLLAYQPVGPKLARLMQLIKQYPATQFSCLADNLASATQISAAAHSQAVTIPVFLDLNVGMNRTGIAPTLEALDLYHGCRQLPGIGPIGLHAYDGHLRQVDIRLRTRECDAAFRGVEQLRDLIMGEGWPEPVIIAGGSPTFPIHAKRHKVECSPGTFIFWDLNYLQTCREQPFEPAAIVLTRIISLLPGHQLCLDLGHKSIAAENTIDKRVHFLNAPQLQCISQSEEHLVVQAPEGHTHKIGEVLYGLPFHICPSVALYERAIVIENNEMTAEWKIVARDRKITI